MNINPYGGRCGECFHLDRCLALIGPDNIKPENTHCDWDPSRWRPSVRVVKMGLVAIRADKCEVR
jgi:hypothetical protein